MCRRVGPSKRIEMFGIVSYAFEPMSSSLRNCARTCTIARFLRNVTQGASFIHTLRIFRNGNESRPKAALFRFGGPRRQPRSRQTYPNRVLRQRHFAPFHSPTAFRTYIDIDRKNMFQEPGCRHPKLDVDPRPSTANANSKMMPPQPLRCACLVLPLRHFDPSPTPTPAQVLQRIFRHRPRLRFTACGSRSRS